MSDPDMPFLDFSETVLSNPDASPREPLDAQMLHVVERAQLPRFRGGSPDGSVADFLAFCRQRFADNPTLLGGLSPNDAGRLLAAQLRLLDGFNRQQQEDLAIGQAAEARRLTLTEFRDEAGASDG